MSQRRDDAVGQMVGFLVAGVVFLGAVGFVLMSTQMANQDTEPVRHAGDQQDTAGMLDILLNSPGAGWENGAEAVTRLGLARDGGGLDPLHLEELTLGGVVADPDNGYLDYEEAKAILAGQGITGVDFKIRIVPAPVDGSEALKYGSLTGVRTAYIGHWDSLLPVSVPVGTVNTMLVAAQEALDSQMDAAADAERGYLVQLGLAFNDSVYIGSALDISVAIPLLPDVPLLDYIGLGEIDGDVYPDDKQYLSDHLPGRLDQYDLIVVGSDVEHSELSSSAVKNAIGDWVDGGGRLLVLGGGTLGGQWLEPVVHVSASDGAEDPIAVDPDHPILNEPNKLDWADYPTSGKAWDLPTTGSNAAYDLFDHFLAQEEQDALAVSQPGAVGDGRLLLSTYRPGDIAGALGDREALGFLENMVRFIAGDVDEYLFLDFGPDPPATGVTADFRTTYTWSSDDVLVPIRVELLVWPE